MRKNILIMYFNDHIKVQVHVIFERIRSGLISYSILFTQVNKSSILLATHRTYIKVCVLPIETSCRLVSKLNINIFAHKSSCLSISQFVASCTNVIHPNIYDIRLWYAGPTNFFSVAWSDACP